MNELHLSIWSSGFMVGGRMFFSGRIPYLAASLFLPLAMLGCQDPTRPSQNAPQNVRMVIDDDSAATRDTVLRVRSTGLNIDIMQLDDDSALAGVSWGPYQELKILHATRDEGTFTAYGRFATAGGGTTAVIRDDIELDFTALIQSVEASAAADTLYPGDCIQFWLKSGEEGSARVSFGNLINYHRLERLEVGLFHGLLSIPRGIRDSSAATIGYFTDAVGNEAEPVTADRRFVIKGPAMEPEVTVNLPLEGVQGADVWLYRGVCFLSDWNGAVHLINVSDPASPVLAGSIRMAGWTFGMDGNDNLLYAADGESGLAIISVRPPEMASVVNRIPISGEPRDVVLNYGYAYVSCIYTGLKVFDIASGESPREIITIGLTTYGEHIWLEASRVYVTGQWGVAVVNIELPDEPRIVSELVIPGIPQTAALLNGALYVATEERGLMAYDLSDPRNPRLVAGYPQVENASALGVSWPYLFAGGDGVLWVLAATDPCHVKEVGRVEGLGRIRGILVTERYLYLAERDGFAIVNLYPEVE